MSYMSESWAGELLDSLCNPSQSLWSLKMILIDLLPLCIYFKICCNITYVVIKFLQNVTSLFYDCLLKIEI